MADGAARRRPRAARRASPRTAERRVRRRNGCSAVAADPALGRRLERLAHRHDVRPLAHGGQLGRPVDDRGDAARGRPAVDGRAQPGDGRRLVAEPAGGAGDRRRQQRLRRCGRSSPRRTSAASRWRPPWTSRFVSTYSFHGSPVGSGRGSAASRRCSSASGSGAGTSGRGLSRRMPLRDDARRLGLVAVAQRRGGVVERRHGVVARAPRRPSAAASCSRNARKTVEPAVAGDGEQRCRRATVRARLTYIITARGPAGQEAVEADVTTLPPSSGSTGIRLKAPIATPAHHTAADAARAAALGGDERVDAHRQQHERRRR